jgi:hypothetical protein
MTLSFHATILLSFSVSGSGQRQQISVGDPVLGSLGSSSGPNAGRDRTWGGNAAKPRRLLYVAALSGEPRELRWATRERRVSGLRFALYCVRPPFALRGGKYRRIHVQRGRPDRLW